MTNTKIHRLVDAAQAIWARVDAEGREAKPEELERVKSYLDQVARLKHDQQAMRALGGGGSYNVTPTEAGSGAGGGWSTVAEKINIKAGRVKAEVPLASLMRRKDISGATEPAGFTPVSGPLVQQGYDSRYLYPLMPRQPLGPSNLSVQDWRQTGRNVSGSVERDPFSTGEKAELNVQVQFGSEDVRQVAVTISNVPNAILESGPLFRTFLQMEAQQQLDAAIDEHVLNQILAANPPSGLDGATLIEQVRHAVSAMRTVGAVPTVLALSPEDAAALDLTQTGTDQNYLFPTRASGTASPLYGLTIVESPRIVDPMLLDPQRLGVLYAGQIKVDLDPFSGFRENTSTLRLEGYVLMHIRTAEGAYEIAAVS